MTSTVKFTNCVVDVIGCRDHFGAVLPKDEFLAEIRRRAGKDAEVGRALSIPSSRVAELFSGKRGLRYEEAKILADRFMPDAPSAHFNATVLTSTFAMLLDSIGVDPNEDERAQKLARQFPNALKSMSNLRGGLASGKGSTPSKDALDPDEDQPSA